MEAMYERHFNVIQEAHEKREEQDKEYEKNKKHMVCFKCLFQCCDFLFNVHLLCNISHLTSLSIHPIIC